MTVSVSSIGGAAPDESVVSGQAIHAFRRHPRAVPIAPVHEAIDLCNTEQPDLVILDVMLPKRSGFLTLEKIKGREDSPLVIMVTANEGKRHQDYAEALGVDAYLLKPVPLERLLDTAEHLIAKADAED